MTLVEMIRKRGIWRAATATRATPATEASKYPLSVARGAMVETRSTQGLNSIVSEPAVMNARPIYWETGTGQILGPAVPEFLTRDRGTFGIVTTFEGTIWWINADHLRSKNAFETQSAQLLLQISPYMPRS